MAKRRRLQDDLDELEEKDPEVRKARTKHNESVRDITGGHMSRRHQRLQQQLARRQQWRR